MTSANPLAQPAQLIRLALIAGVLMFGGVSLFLHTQPGWKPVTLPLGVYYALAALALAAVPIAMVFKRRAMSESDPQRRVSMLMSGWAVGEGVGLFGGVTFFLTGNSQWYLLGLLALAYVFGTLRIRALA
jgi:hypothetical protein